MQISDRAKNTAPSPTLAITAKVRALKAQGVDVIGFGAGEPDFDTPEAIKKAAIQAIQSGFTKYTPSTGTPEIKDSIIAKFKRDNNLDYTRKEIVLSCGAKHSLFNTFMALINPGDEVIVPSPYWVSYPEMAKLAGGIPVFVETSEENGFRLTAAMLEKAITPKTRAVVINSPSNPTGAVIDPKELKAIAELVVKHNLYAISDEIYEKLIYDENKHISIASLGDDIKKQTITINGFSKAYSMTGWRMGYLGCAEEIASAIGRIQDNSTSNPVSFCQKGGVEALNGSQDVVKMMVAEFDKRRKYIVSRLNAMPGVKCPNPGGAFYVFPNVSGLYKGEIKGSKNLTEFLLENYKVAVVPGEGFGADNYIRLSYATSMENIEKGMDRFEKAAKEITA